MNPSRVQRCRLTLDSLAKDRQKDQVGHSVRLNNNQLASKDVDNRAAKAKIKKDIKTCSLLNVTEYMHHADHEKCLPDVQPNSGDDALEQAKRAILFEDKTENAHHAHC